METKRKTVEQKETTSGHQPRSVLERKIGRRRLLKGIARGMAGLTTAAVLGRLAIAPEEEWPLSSLILDTKEYQPPELPPKPKELPPDVLTEEELKKANIVINQNSNVQLYLRKEALQFQLFADAAEGRIDGVVISLIDHDRLSWNAVGKLPLDARIAWQAFEFHPSEYPEYYWQELAKYWQEASSYYQKQMSESQRRINFYQSPEGSQPLEGGDRNELIQEELQIQQEVKQELERTKQELAILEDRKRAIEHYAQDPPVAPQGMFNGPGGFTDEYLQLITDLSPQTRRRIAFLKSHPEWRKKAYIYLSVGKEYAPKPSQSYPNPEWFEQYPDGEVFIKSEKVPLPGFIFRHEIAHYEENKGGEESEKETDRIAFEKVVQAWRKYQQSGDTSGYPFVFVTPEGITITKKIGNSKSQV